MTPAELVKKKGGRPPNPQKRDKQITVLFSGVEYLATKRRAQMARLPLSDYCRQLVLTGKAEAKLTPEQNTLLNQLASLGNNLNQIAKRANTDGIRSIAIEANRLLGQLGKLLDPPQEP